jgi:hypothetical protein
MRWHLRASAAEENIRRRSYYRRYVIWSKTCVGWSEKGIITARKEISGETRCDDICHRIRPRVGKYKVAEATRIEYPKQELLA